MTFGTGIRWVCSMAAKPMSVLVELLSVTVESFRVSLVPVEIPVRPTQGRGTPRRRRCERRF